MCDVVLSLEDGSKVLDTREAGTPIAFQVGITNPRGRAAGLEGGARLSIPCVGLKRPLRPLGGCAPHAAPTHPAPAEPAPPDPTSTNPPRSRY
jgi:hypothetical protein